MLVDSLGRRIDYLRLSVTDRCNLNCIYCSPKEVHWLRRGEILSYEEMATIVHVFSQLGVRHVRLTGGEPLMRRDFIRFVEEIGMLGVPLDLSLTTNGLLLSEKAAALRRAGLDRVNISLDSLDREKYRRITGVDGLTSVMKGIDASLDAGLTPVKLNVVLVKSLNGDEVDSFVRLAETRPLSVRFIEFMPAGLAEWDRGNVIPARTLLDELKRKFGLSMVEQSAGGGPSRDFSFPGMRGSVGFISSVTEPSCERCNRLRVTAEGRLRPCLFSETELDLKASLRGGAPEEDVRRVIIEGVRIKPEGRHPQCAKDTTGKPMAQIGG
jgi:cyclic pyranopterin phosphate synthase